VAEVLSDLSRSHDEPGIAVAAGPRAFYGKLDFQVVGGHAGQNWLVLRNGLVTIGCVRALRRSDPDGNMILFDRHVSSGPAIGKDTEPTPRSRTRGAGAGCILQHMTITRHAAVTLCLAVGVMQLPLAQTTPAPQQTPATRRSQRLLMPPLDVNSPNGQVTFRFLPNAERLTFTVTLGNTPVIDPSPIVLTLDGYDLSAGVVMRGVVRDAITESYPWSGVRSTAVSRSNRATLSLTNDLTSTAYTLEVRAFDDGVAFRHVIPGEAAVPRVPDELSTFNLPVGSTVWYAGMDGHYEAPYSKKDAAAVQPGEWAGPPLTFKLLQNAGYASITEANLVNYSGMGLESNGRGGWVIGLGHRQPLNYPFELRYGREEGRRLGKAAAITGEITTPWRVVMIGRDLDTLATSTILPNLCPPPDPALFPDGIRTPWVTPGRAVWRYVDGGPTGVEGMKEFSRLAGQLGFEHHVIEGVWSKWTMDERRDVVSYSRQQGVGVWFWRHTNQLRTPAAREEFFRMLRDLGVTGAKLDFFDHEAKEVIDLYEALLRTAAEHQILLVFHGSNKPTGRERTWPHELVRESVRGMESRAMVERARHQTILPFTRYLAGPADYTAMVFNERRGDSSVAHQIASLAVFASPLLTVAANPESILASPAVDVIKSIPSTWDETRVLTGSEIGELVLFARRKGSTWFLAAMCGPDARTLEVPLSFLGAGQYRSTLVRDGAPDGSTVTVESAVHTQKDTLALALGPGGGFVGRFSPGTGR
jgi:alpha-glucosidase